MGAVPRRGAAHGVSDASPTATPRWWVVEERVGTAGGLHHPWPDDDLAGQRRVALCRVVGTESIVVGSSQRPTPTGASPPVVRRGTGGGAVVVRPDGQVWVDVWLPRGDVLWDDDVVRAANWLGQAWAEALRTLVAGVALRSGRPAVDVHRGRLERGPWSDRICFAALGPGEVTVSGRKVVGVAQRRTRLGARFHTVAHLDWDPARTVGLLVVAGVVSPTDAAAAVGHLAGSAAGVRSIVAPTRRRASDLELRVAVERALLVALDRSVAGVDQPSPTRTGSFSPSPVTGRSS